MPVLLQNKVHNKATNLSSPNFIMKVQSPPCSPELLLDSRWVPIFGESSNKCTSILICLFVHSSISTTPGPAPNPCCLSK
ncbi:Carboxylesterase NlhH [Fusarium oxysporum f. sp. albedinis]|nr:Carboxylesterase NlhH [Fusarium oxysporum f. sp. albedinis]